MTGYSDRQVQRMIVELVKIKCLIPEGDSRLGTRQYRIEKASLPVRPELVLQRRGRPAKNGDIVSPYLNNGDISEKNGDILGENGDIAMSPDSSLEPSFDSSKDGGEKNAPPPELEYVPDEDPETPPLKTSSKVPQQQLRPMQQALGLVMGFDMNISSNFGKVGRLSRDLLKAKYKPEDITRIYGRGGIWFTQDWRGKKGDLPNMASIAETIGNFSKRITTTQYNAEAAKAAAEKALREALRA